MPPFLSAAQSTSLNSRLIYPLLSRHLTCMSNTSNLVCSKQNSQLSHQICSHSHFHLMMADPFFLLLKPKTLELSFITLTPSVHSTKSVGFYFKPYQKMAYSWWILQWPPWSKSPSFSASTLAPLQSIFNTAVQVTLLNSKSEHVSQNFPYKSYIW